MVGWNDLCTPESHLSLAPLLLFIWTNWEFFVASIFPSCGKLSFTLKVSKQQNPFVKPQQIFSLYPTPGFKYNSHFRYRAFPLNNNCTYFLDVITSNNFCVVQWCNISVVQWEDMRRDFYWPIRDKPCMFRQDITWWIGFRSYENKLSQHLASFHWNPPSKKWVLLQSMDLKSWEIKRTRLSWWTNLW